MKSLLWTRTLSWTGLLCFFLCFSTLGRASGEVQAASAPADAGAVERGSPATVPPDLVLIPGPLRSFLRMAGISQQVAPDDVLALLARNVYIEGYLNGRPTEFLILIGRYVRQARELQLLAGTTGTIHVSNCDDVGPLLHILGYRIQGSCGQKNAYLITADPARAFLTIDSGFPLTKLEEAIERGSSFSDPYPSSRVPALLTERDWTELSARNGRGSADLLDALIDDVALARLYWALDQNDGATRVALQRTLGLRKLLPFAAILDFYGSQIRIQSGRVIVPGGIAAEPAWKNLVGASPESPRDFVFNLISRDNGWLVTYFDCLARINSAQQAHFTETPRLRRLYEAFRDPDPGAKAAGAAFRRAPGLLILLTRLEWTSGDEPRVPGNLEAWEEILGEKTDSKPIRDWTKRARHWNSPEQLLEAMAAFSSVEIDDTPLNLYLMVSEIDNRRPPDKRLSPNTVLLLGRNFSELGSWYPIFTEFPGLDEQSIAHFIDVAGSVDKIASQSLREDTTGILQADIGFWQILARQGEIPAPALNASWQKTIAPFAGVSSSAQLFDAGQASLGELLLAAGGKTGDSRDELIDLIAGPPQGSPEGQRVHEAIADKIRSALADQRLVPLDTLTALGNGLTQVAVGTLAGGGLVPLAAELQEFEMPRQILTTSERAEWASNSYDHRHAELQVRTSLMKILKTPGSRAELREARGELAPFLRDTLVGLNYAYYDPPGAQVLRNDPAFVRLHDFSGENVLGAGRYWQVPLVSNSGSAAGGAYLIGSLADLPYIMAEAEQNFIAPENIQALIWETLTPELLTSATVPRWWNVSPNELHAVALYQRSGEELLTRSQGSEALRAKVTSILSDRIPPKSLAEAEEAMRAGTVAAYLPRMTPADVFYLAVEFRRRFPGEIASWGPASQQLEDLCHQDPAGTSWARISNDFGVPHPVLAGTYARELLNVQLFPPFEGRASRMSGESWDSSNLYWARLADEKGYAPVTLNLLIPELTRRMAAKIFASQLEDWPAVLRAMRETGEDFRRGEITAPPSTSLSELH